MNRLQKKCFLAATGFHLLLIVLLFVGPAFMSSKDDLRNLQVIDIIPSTLIDKPFAGGGDPKAQPPPPSTQPQPQPPAPVQPKVAKTEPEPQKPPPKQKAAVPEPKAEPKKYTPKISTELVPRKSDQKSPVKNQPNRETNTKAQPDEKLRAFNESIRNLRDSFSPSTSVGVPGPGGEAYAGYDIVVQSIYQKKYDQELPGAGDIADRRWEVEVSVTVARNGNVISSHITNPSGNAALNKLVQRVLDKVTFIAPFPQASKDQQRTFTIIFDLKPRKAIG